MSKSIKLKVSVRGKQHTFALGADNLLRPVSHVLREHRLPLNTRCGGKGVCDGCQVELIDQQGHAILIRACEYSATEIARSFALSGLDTLTLNIPTRSLLVRTPQIVSNFKVNIPRASNPLGHKGHSSGSPPLGVAVDIGTTTVTVMLVDMNTGNIKACKSSFNRQMHYADDVVSRITMCVSNPEMITKLQEAVVKQTIQPLVDDALREADAALETIGCYTVAANTTMLHLFAGIDPSSMGVAPFNATFLDHRVLSTADVGLAGRAGIHLLPGSAAYLGADIVAGSLVTAQAYDEGPTLLVDVGTNGEIVLKIDGRLIACATAAGPAFEGARLSSGVRAMEGAIEHIRFNDDVEPSFDIIAATAPVGICGSAYVDFLSEARRVGLLSSAGRFSDAHRTIAQGRHGRYLRLFDDQAHPIIISEQDIATLLQAKAAIASGIITLLQKSKITPAEIRRVHLAGGFGLHINSESAIGSGLLPGFEASRVEAVGNTSLGGAYLALLDSGIIEECARIARDIEVIELNLEPEFETNYIDQLSLP